MLTSRKHGAREVWLTVGSFKVSMNLGAMLTRRKHVRGLEGGLEDMLTGRKHGTRETMAERGHSGVRDGGRA